MSNQGSTSKTILFEVGTRIEAQDFTQKWYPAKICRVEPSERKALIHFEGWNQRFDEWISYDSVKIRPYHRSTDIKEDKTEPQCQMDVYDYKDWKNGDRLLAKWIDGKYYSAKVTKNNDDGTLEVLFYDGFKKIVQRSHVKPDNRKSQALPVSKDRLNQQMERMERKSKLANARAQRAQKRSKEMKSIKKRTKKPRHESDSVTPRESNASSPVSDNISVDDDIKNISGSSSFTAEESEPKSVDTSLEDTEDIKPLQSTPQKPQIEKMVQSEESVKNIEKDEPPYESNENQASNVNLELDVCVASTSNQDINQGHKDSSADTQGDTEATQDNKDSNWGHKDSTKVTQSKKDSTKVTQSKKDSTKVTQSKKDSTKVTQGNKDGIKVTQGNKDSIKVAQGDNDSIKVAQGDNDITKVIQGDKDSTKVTHGDKDSTKVTHGDKHSTKVTHGDKNSTKVTHGDKHSTKVTHGDKDSTKVTHGDKDSTKVTQCDKDSIKGTLDKKDSSADTKSNKDSTWGDMNSTDSTKGDKDSTKGDKHSTKATQGNKDCNKDIEKPDDSTNKERPDEISNKNVIVTEDRCRQDKNEDINVPYIEVVSVEAKDKEAKVENYSENLQDFQQNTSQENKLQKSNEDDSLKQSSCESKGNDSKGVSKKAKISPKTLKKQPGEKRRATRSRSAISPRGYGYSMAVMHPQVPKQEAVSTTSEASNTAPTSATLDKIIDSLTEDSAVVDIQPVLDIMSDSSQENNPTTTTGKTKNFQAKKFRLNQITGKLSAQRQIEAGTTVQSPSAFQMTVSPSPPPPPRLPTPPPTKLPSPKQALGSHYPMDTNYSVPPPLIYASPTNPPCCNNPHCQQHYPHPPRMTHPMHLTPSHLHAHSAGGYVMYPPGPPTYDTRPPMACSCANCTAPVYHMQQDAPPHHESALARLMQVEQRLIHTPPTQHIPHYREAPARHGSWLPHSLSHASQYRPLPPKHDDMKWRHEPPHPVKSSSHHSPSSENEAAKLMRRWKPTDHDLKTSMSDVRSTENKHISATPKESVLQINTETASVKQPVMVDEKTTEQEIKEPQQTTPQLFTGISTPTVTTPLPNPALGGRPRKGKEAGHVAPKELVIELDHNKYKCPIKDCDKSFRKKSGLDYHTKYYHSPGGKEIKRKRSSASMRSDGTPESSPDVSGPSKRRCHRSSAPGQLSTEQVPIDMLVSPSEDIMVDSLSSSQDIELEIEPGTESESSFFGSVESVEEEVPRDGDVIRCRCGETEEGGFMIQCEQCLTWQHSECVALTEQTVPSKYLCYVCSNPKGLRKSAKHKNNFDWFKKGSLSKFSFSKDEKDNVEYDSQISLATHGLVADLHDVNHVLKSLQVKIDILGSPNHPALGMWCRTDDAPPTTPNKDYSTSLLMVKPLSNGINKPALTDHNQNGIDNNNSALLNGDISEQSLSLSVNQSTDPVVDTDVVSPLPPLVPVGSTLESNDMPESVDKQLDNHTAQSSANESAPTIVDSSSSIDKDDDDSKSRETHIAMMNLLDDVSELQESLETRLDVIERQIEVLEQKSESCKGSASKPDLRKLIKDLSRIKRLALHVG